MTLRLLPLLAILGLNACSMAQMAVDPQLNNNFDKFSITHLPGGGIGFGSYLSSNMDRSWTRGDGITIGPYKGERRHQSYTFDFKGAGDWKAECVMRSQSRQLGIVGFDQEIGIECTFAQTGGENSNFSLKFSGSRLVEAQGSFSAGAETLTVVPNLKLQGSPFSMGYPSGYYIYSGSDIVAGVDSISGNGPVWLKKDLSRDVKDRVSMVLISLLLIQE